MHRAAIFIQRGVPADKQTTALLHYVLGEHMSMLAIVPYWQPADAVALVRSGAIDTIVAAFDSKAVQQLAFDLAGLGSVVVIHPQPRIVEAPKAKLSTIADLILRWFRRGRSVEDIAADLESATVDVRAVLRRHGEDTTRSP